MCISLSLTSTAQLTGILDGLSDIDSGHDRYLEDGRSSTRGKFKIYSSGTRDNRAHLPFNFSLSTPIARVLLLILRLLSQTTTTLRLLQSLAVETTGIKTWPTSSACVFRNPGPHRRPLLWQNNREAILQTALPVLPSPQLLLPPSVLQQSLL